MARVFICSGKTRDSAGRILGYNLIDPNLGMSFYMGSEDLKKSISSGRFRIRNLKLTSDNHLIDYSDFDGSERKQLINSPAQYQNLLKQVDAACDNYLTYLFSQHMGIESKDLAVVLLNSNSSNNTLVLRVIDFRHNRSFDIFTYYYFSCNQLGTIYQIGICLRVLGIKINGHSIPFEDFDSFLGTFGIFDSNNPNKVYLGNDLKPYQQRFRIRIGADFVKSLIWYILNATVSNLKDYYTNTMKTLNATADVGLQYAEEVHVLTHDAEVLMTVIKNVHHIVNRLTEMIPTFSVSIVSNNSLAYISDTKAVS